MSVECDRYGFFNGIYGIEQSNWANYWRGIIPDGVIALQGNEMQVYAQSDGRKVHIKTGQAMVDNHRVWITAEKELTLAENTSGNPRIDLVVLRAVYGNTGESVMEIDAKVGTPAADPSAPTPTTITGDTYEIPLAEVLIPNNYVTIPAENVTDRRYVYKLGNDSVSVFTGTSVNCVNDIEYRNPNEIGSLTINLPAAPNDTYITGVNFTANASFSGVTFRKGSSSITPKMIGDGLSLKSRRYNLVIWWDSGYNQFWCAAKAVS